MLRIYGCVTQQHDLRLVVLAAAICIFGCYTALSLLARARGQCENKRAVGWRWLTAAAIVAGAGVWTTHFVGELAFRPGLPIGYDFTLTGLSIAIAMVLTWIGFAVALRFSAPAIGGAIFGSAVCAMHFTGMAALEVPGHIEWDPAFILASLAISIVFGALGLAAFAHGRALRWHLAATALLTFAIAGLHFTAMTAANLVSDPGVALPPEVMAPEWLAIIIAAVMIVIVVLGLSGSAVDQHLAERAAQEAVRLHAHIAELEATKRLLEATAADLETALEAAAAASQAKSQFLATMSHELRTPLNAIVGFSEMLAKENFGPLGDERYRDFAKTVQESGVHLLGLINDVLDYSKVDAGHLDLEDEAVDLAEIMRTALRMIAGQAEAAHVRLIDAVPPDLPYIRADQRRVCQVLLNLLSNAVKFTPEGGEVRVSASLAAAGVTIAVADTGIGIAQEDIPRALERFGQVDNVLSRRYEGTGLGLPLSKRLMELHGGTLTLESTVGVGTTVLASFPRDRLIDLQAA
jgi:signal transduction histidine kinase